MGAKVPTIPEGRVLRRRGPAGLGRCSSRIGDGKGQRRDQSHIRVFLTVARCLCRPVTASSSQQLAPSAGCLLSKLWAATAATWPPWRGWRLGLMLPTFLRSPSPSETCR